MKPNELIKYCGTAAKAAQCAKVHIQTIMLWSRKGFIPIHRQAFIAMRTGGALNTDKIKLWSRK